MNNRIAELYSVCGMSLSQVSVALSVPVSSVRRHLLKAGLLRTRSEGCLLAWKTGAAKGRTGTTFSHSDQAKEKMSKSRKLWAEKNAKKRGIDKGYVRITSGEHAGRHEHVVIMESLIGRKLLKNETIHHKDENRTNNAVENLQLMTRHEHSRLHAISNHKSRARNSLGQFS